VRVSGTPIRSAALVRSSDRCREACKTDPAALSRSTLFAIEAKNYKRTFSSHRLGAPNVFASRQTGCFDETPSSWKVKDLEQL
jgi:hypothetical protein